MTMRFIVAIFDSRNNFKRLESGIIAIFGVSFM